MKKNYFRTRLLNVPAQFEDLFTQLAFDHGSTGVSEALDYIQKDLAYEPKIQMGDTHVMDVFFEETPSPDYFLDFRSVPQLK